MAPDGTPQLDIDASGFLREENVRFSAYEIQNRNIVNDIHDMYVEMTPTNTLVPIFVCVVGFVCAYIDDDNVLFTQMVGNGASSVKLIITEYVSGTPTTINNTNHAYSWVVGTPTELRARIDFESNEIKLYVDGSLKVTKTFSADYDSVGASFGIIGEALRTAGPFNTAYADNFLVRGSSTVGLPDPPGSWDADVSWADGADSSPYTATITLPGPAGGGGGGSGQRFIGG
jgi:hypothetical protein